MSPIKFFKKGIFNEEIPNHVLLRRWLTASIAKEGGELQTLHITLCDDACLHKINKKHLKHDTLTDIITFSYGQRVGEVNAEIYISIPRVAENALTFAASFEEELARVMIHGVLHLLGYDDKQPKQEEQMRKKEDFYLSLKQAKYA